MYDLPTIEESQTAIEEGTELTMQEQLPGKPEEQMLNAEETTLEDPKAEAIAAAKIETMLQPDEQGEAEEKADKFLKPRADVPK